MPATSGPLAEEDGLVVWRETWLALLVVIGSLVVVDSRPAVSAEAAANYAAQGRDKFTQRKYDEAIDLLRQHLRRNPKDYNTWNLLAAAYYYTGQPRRALRYLKHAERLTSDKSYNYYYQGLCYEAVAPATVAIATPAENATARATTATAASSALPAEIAKAKDYFTYAAQRYSDEYASRATFELGVIEYNSRNKPKAQSWLTLYQQRYPHGVYGMPAQHLLQSLRDNHWIENVEGTRKPDMEEALFKYNKLSFSPTPHFWFVQGGFQYVNIAAEEPTQAGQIAPNNYQDIAMLANAGVGIGPLRDGDITAFAGYTYRQTWDTDMDRINEWLAAPTALDYFPFRADLLTRQHQFYGDVRRDFHSFYLGVYGRFEYARIGSTYFPSPESPTLRETLNLSETELLIPWIGFSYLDNFRTLFYLYFNKEIDFDTPEFSNKSYDFGIGGGQPTVSYGISNTADFPRYDLTLDLELFQYEFVYNDPWLDYKRQGLFLGVQQEVIPHWTVAGIAGYYQDTYVFPRIKTYSCGTASDAANPLGTLSTPATPVSCNRVDTGTLYELGLYWNWSQFQRLSLIVEYINNANSQQQEFNSTTESIQVMYTLAFPSVQRVSRFIDRFADAAFTKGSP